MKYLLMFLAVAALLGTANAKTSRSADCCGNGSGCCKTGSACCHQHK